MLNKLSFKDVLVQILYICDKMICVSEFAIRKLANLSVCIWGFSLQSYIKIWNDQKVLSEWCLTFFLQSLGISIILETTMELNFSTQLTILSSYYLLYSISVLKIHVGVNFSCFGIVHSCYFANLVNFMAVRYKALPTKCKLYGSTPGDTNNFTSYFGY